MPNRVATPLLTIFLLCTALLAAATPAASASQESREARRIAHEVRRAAHEARREARQAERATRRREHEERRALHAAEREGRAVEGGEADVSNESAPVEVAAPPLASEPAPAEAHRGVCTLSAAASAAQVTAGEAVTISGKLTCPTVEAASGQEVTVYQHEAGASSSTPTVVGTATTAADGSYEFHSAVLSMRSVFVVRTAGAAHQARVVVVVSADITLQGPAASGATLAIAGGRASGVSDRLRFSGVVKPAWAAKLLELRVQETDGRWRTVAFTRTDAEGNYTFSHSFRYAGEVSVMVVAHMRQERSTRSAPLTYIIAQAQNSALTIHAAPATLGPDTTTAADVASPTPATTITGVAAGAPGRPVVLLARELGSSRLVPVASATTDSTGAYSFTVNPTATTIYKVRCERTRSTVVRVQFG